MLDTDNARRDRQNRAKRRRNVLLSSFSGELVVARLVGGRGRRILRLGQRGRATPQRRTRGSRGLFRRRILLWRSDRPQQHIPMIPGVVVLDGPPQAASAGACRLRIAVTSRPFLGHSLGRRQWSPTGVVIASR